MVWPWGLIRESRRRLGTRGSPCRFASMGSPGSENGISLARAYWSHVVRPILDDHRPLVPRAAARGGSGSDVLGQDDHLSRDHDWGLRLQLFVRTSAKSDIYSRSSKSSSSMSSRACPLVSHSPVRTNTGSRLTCSALTNLSQPSSGSIRAGGATPLEWLSLTGQAALEVTAGAVFEDPADEPTSLRDALAWYPDDVWRYVVACDWRSILGSSLPPHQPAHHPATARRHLRPSSPRSSCRAGQHRAAHRQCRPVGARQSPARRCPWRPGAHGERVRPGCLVPATVPCSATFRDPQPNPPASASARWHGPADRARR